MGRTMLTSALVARSGMAAEKHPSVNVALHEAMLLFWDLREGVTSCLSAIGRHFPCAESNSWRFSDTTQELKIGVKFRWNPKSDLISNIESLPCCDLNIFQSSH